jgi:hypothetical protein
VRALVPLAGACGCESNGSRRDQGRRDGARFRARAAGAIRSRLGLSLNNR